MITIHYYLLNPRAATAEMGFGFKIMPPPIVKNYADNDRRLIQNEPTYTAGCLNFNPSRGVLSLLFYKNRFLL